MSQVVLTEPNLPAMPLSQWVREGSSWFDAQWVNICGKDLPCGVQDVSALMLDAGRVPLCKGYLQAPFYSSALPACGRCLPANSRREH